MMTPAMARRIQTRVDEYRAPPTPLEEQAMLLDWLEGATQAAVGKKHHRSTETVRQLLIRFKAEAKALLAAQTGIKPIHEDD